MLPKSKPLKYSILFVCVLVLIFSGWYFTRPKKDTNQYLTADVSVGDIENTVLATGTLQAQQLVSVGAQVSGQVKKMYVKLGDEVKQGQLIAQIDSVRQENDLKNQEAAIDNLEAQKQVRLATLKESELAFKRQKEMLAKDATSRAEYEQADAALATAKANIAAIDAQIQQSRLTVSTARENVGYTRISAPIDGTVVAIVTEEGQTVNANQSAPTIVKLAKLQTMTINAQVSEADVIKIKKGQNVYFTTLGDPDTKHYATLRDIEPAPDSIKTESASSSSSSASSTAIYYNALFDVPNTDGQLRIDMTAQVYIVLDDAKNVLTVPAAALTMANSKGGKHKAGQQNNSTKPAQNSAADSTEKAPSADHAGADKGAPGKRATVRVLNADGSVEERKVRIGLNNRITAEVLSGLKEGEKVVLADATDTSQNESKRSSSNRPPMRF